MASGDTLVCFFPVDNEPPAASYATFDTRNAHPTLDFDDASTEAAVFTFILPANYSGGGITITLSWAATSATTGDVVWQTSFEDINGTQDLDADNFATAVTWAANTCNGTNGVCSVNSQGHTNGAQIGSIAIGDVARLKVERVGGSGSDTMAGDAEFVSVLLKET